MRFCLLDCVVSVNMLNCYIFTAAFIYFCFCFTVGRNLFSFLLICFIFLCSFSLKQTLMSWSAMYVLVKRWAKTIESGQQWAHFINISTHIFAHRISNYSRSIAILVGVFSDLCVFFSVCLHI